MTDDEIREVLSESDLFGNLSPEELDAVVPLARCEERPAGVTFSRQGQVLDTVYVVAEGLVHLTMAVRIWERGATLTSIVSSVEPGESFGWSSVVEPNQATLSAEMVDACRLIAIEAAPLRQLMERDHSLGYRLMGNLAGLVARRLRATQECVQRLRAEDLREHT